MKRVRIVVFLTVLLLVIGCGGKDPARLLIGQWELDENGLKTLLENDGAAESGLFNIEKFYFEFFKEGIVVQNTYYSDADDQAHEPFQFTWKLEEGNKLYTSDGAHYQQTWTIVSITKSNLVIDLPGIDDSIMRLSFVKQVDREHNT